VEGRGWSMECERRRENGGGWERSHTCVSPRGIGSKLGTATPAPRPATHGPIVPAPAPHCPVELSPHAYAAPSAHTHAECASPHATLLTFRRPGSAARGFWKPLRRTGVDGASASRATSRPVRRGRRWQGGRWGGVAGEGEGDGVAQRVRVRVTCPSELKALVVAPAPHLACLRQTPYPERRSRRM
jgi:hypothetical protein